ncbi:MoaD/ThiS family protein [Corynebacterium sp.]|uniref:MoaD/ThiS family protein n=1 Tax=Corynebacterium sp. TaxID=1720 RepID=UPI0026DC4A51|nr:MoaD/ThiS family protein [Corynebacterium sp.]MDO5032556.1 MoaD/ThiS family protein [Corynebacterium sp.]
MLEIHYFAAARQAAGVAQESVEAQATLGELLDALVETHPGTTEAGMSFAEVLERCTFLVDGAHAKRAATLAGATRVDVLPPFAGG